MLGHELPSPEATRRFLYAFHDEGRIEQAQAELRSWAETWELVPSTG